MRLLLLEGDKVLGDGMTKYLRGEGHEVHWFERFGDIGPPPHPNYQLVVADVSRQDVPAPGCIQALRRAHAGVPLLLIVAEERRDDWLHGVENGVVDFLVKPFEPAELADRVRRVAQRAERPAPTRLHCGDVELDIAFETVFRGGARVDLTSREWRLVKALAQRADQIVPKPELQKLVHGPDAQLTSNALEVHLWSVRRKLGRDFIRTVRGVGYRLRR